MLSAIVDWLASVVGAMAVLCWCAGWVFILIWLCNQLPMDGATQRATLSVAGLAGLGIALWTLKLALGIKRL